MLPDDPAIGRSTSRRVTGHPLLFFAALAITGCSVVSAGYVVDERPVVLEHPCVQNLDPTGDGSQAREFLAAHASHETSGLCARMLSEEAMPSDWCIITEGGQAYWVIDYTQDPLGVDGYRIQPLRHKGGNRFYDAESRQEVRLLPWTNAPVDDGT